MKKGSSNAENSEKTDFAKFSRISIGIANFEKIAKFLSPKCGLGEGSPGSKCFSGNRKTSKVLENVAQML